MDEDVDVGIINVLPKCIVLFSCLSLKVESA